MDPGRNRKAKKKRDIEIEGLVGKRERPEKWKGRKQWWKWR